MAKQFSELVIKEVMVQKTISREAALDHLQKVYDEEQNAQAGDPKIASPKSSRTKKK